MSISSVSDINGLASGGSVPIKESSSAIDSKGDKDLNDKLIKALKTPEKMGNGVEMKKRFNSYVPVHGQMISSSDEAIDESEDELPVIKEVDEDMYFEELREKTKSSPLINKDDEKVVPNTEIVIEKPENRTQSFITSKYRGMVIEEQESDPLLENPSHDTFIVRSLQPTGSGPVFRAILYKNGETHDLE